MPQNAKIVINRLKVITFVSYKYLVSTPMMTKSYG